MYEGVERLAKLNIWVAIQRTRPTYLNIGGGSLIDSKVGFQAHDFLGSFIKTLPEPAAISKQSIVNRKGGEAEVIILQYKEGVGGRRVFHGTHPGGARSILHEGCMRESSDTTVHELSMPGLYVTTKADETLEPYAISVMMTDKYSWSTPYVKAIFVLEPKRKPLRVRLTEEVYRGQDLEILELHFLRGYDFHTAADKYDTFTKNDVDQVQTFPNDVVFPDMGWPHPWGSRGYDGTGSGDIAPRVPPPPPPPPPPTTVGEWVHGWHVAPRVPPPPPPPPSASLELSPASIAPIRWNRHQRQTATPQIATSIVDMEITTSTTWAEWARMQTQRGVNQEMHTPDVGLVEWTAGDRWTWDINFRCAKCDMVKPLNAFSKKQQTYGLTSRTCKQCW